MNIEEIIQIVELQLGQRQIKSGQRLLEDLKAESADLVNIIVKVESRYKIILEEEEIAKIRTVGDIYSAAKRAPSQ